MQTSAERAVFSNVCLFAVMDLHGFDQRMSLAWHYLLHRGFAHA